MAEKLLENKELVVFYFAAVLVLLLLIIMQLYKVGFFMSERFAGNVPDNAQPNNSQPRLYNAGYTQYASVRDDPGASSPGTAENLMNKPPGTEWLVNNRGEPDFWTIEADLGDYQTGEGSDARATGAQLLTGGGQALGPGTAAAAGVAAAASNAALAAGAPPAAAAAAGAAAAERYRSERMTGNLNFGPALNKSFPLWGSEHNDPLAKALAGM